MCRAAASLACSLVLLIATAAAGSPLPPPSAPPPTAMPACRGPSVETLQTRAQGSEHYRFEGRMLEPFLALLALHGAKVVPAGADGADVFVRRDLPLVVTLRGGSCVLAMLLVERRELFDLMRRVIGPVV
jgi:hypothetical protein